MFSDYQNLVDKMVRDQSGELTPGDRDDAIGMAITRYSKDRPRDIVEAVLGDGSGFLPFPASWQVGLSRLSKVGEYEFDIVPTINGDNICVDRPVAEGESVEVRFNTGHVVDEIKDTIPVSDREAVASYAAAELFDQLAALFSGERSSTIQSDQLVHGTKGRNFSQRAEERRARYFELLDIKPENIPPACVNVDWDRGSSRGGDRLIHRRSRR